MYHWSAYIQLTYYFVLLILSIVSYDSCQFVKSFADARGRPASRSSTRSNRIAGVGGDKNNNSNNKVLELQQRRQRREEEENKIKAAAAAARQALEAGREEELRRARENDAERHRKTLAFMAR